MSNMEVVCIHCGFGGRKSREGTTSREVYAATVKVGRHLLMNIPKIDTF